jgi:AcrR family transcriptional regulator
MAKKKERAAPQVDPLIARALDFQPRKGDLKKIQILNLAIEQIGTQGVESLSLDVIAKALKTSRSHVLYYFNDKETLLLSVVRYALATGQEVFVEKVSRPSSPKAKLFGYVDAVFDWAENHPNHAKVLILLYYNATFSEAFRSIYMPVKATAVNRIGATFDSTSSETNEAIYHCLVGYLLSLLNSDLSQSRATFRKAAHRAVLRLAGL